jgi:UDP-2,4-diacetamido-2,4,6-trideoxy-beta-L-altropyranose hydrolase
MLGNCVFRVDSDPEIGVGHLMRCLIIADKLLLYGSECLFLMTYASEDNKELIENREHCVVEIKNHEDYCALLMSYKPEWLIVDHYKLDCKFELSNRAYVNKILVIDDFVNRCHDCDILLDHSPFRHKDEYASLIDNDRVTYCLGNKYALVGSGFVNNRKDISSLKESIIMKYGLISLGGSDPKNITMELLHAIERVDSLKHIHWYVIAGVNNKNWKKIKSYCLGSDLNIVLKKNIENIENIMHKADFSIGGLGMMVWERACIGLPSLSIKIADNQSSNEVMVNKFKLGEVLQASDISSEKIDEKITNLRTNYSEYIKNGFELVDGMGVDRLINIMDKGRLSQS